MAETIDRIADLVAASATFQSITGAANEAAARAVVYTRMWPEDAEPPFAVVAFDLDSDNRSVRRVALQTSLPTGTMSVTVFTNYNETAGDDGDAQLDGLDVNLNAIIEEMLEVAGGAGRILVREIVPEGVAHNDENQFENGIIPSHMSGRMIVHWGLGE